MRLILIALLATVIGCGGSSSSNEDSVYDFCGPVHDLETDIVEESGLYVPAPAQNLFVADEMIEEIYVDMEACIGVPPTPGPTIWFKSFSENHWGGNWGFTHYVGGIVAINTDIDDTNQRNCISDVDTLRHEFIHYITYMNGLDYDHTSPYFKSCNAVGVKTCNGIPCR